MAASLSPLSGHDEIGIPSAALGTSQQPRPIDNRHPRAVLNNSRGNVGLVSVIAALAPQRSNRTWAASAWPKVIGADPLSPLPIAILGQCRGFISGGYASSRSYSAQWRSPRDLARWRDEHVSYRGVYFAA